jgi:hypothetical protein
LYCVYVTVDFIFGDTIIRLWGCNIYARHLDPGRKNAFTVQV